MDPTYSRDECIAAIEDFYAFLKKMYLNVPARIVHPPASGWPNITPEVMNGTGKDKEVVELLRRLPYPEDRPFSEHPDCLLPNNRFFDWKTEVDQMVDGEQDAENLLIGAGGWAHQFGNRIPKHCVGISGVFREKNVILLDTKEGLVYWMDCPEYILEVCEPKPSRLVYPLEGEAEENSDDEAKQEDKETPPTSDENDDNDDDEEEDEDDDDDDMSWCGEIEWGPCWPVRHFFAMLKNHYLKLNFIPYDHQSVIHIWTKEYSNWKELPKGVPEALQAIYHKHGWPDVENFNKEACLAELKKEVAEKFQGINRYQNNR